MFKRVARKTLEYSLILSLVGATALWAHSRVKKLIVLSTATFRGNVTMSGTGGLDVSGGDITMENDELLINSTDADFEVRFNDDAATLGQVFIASSVDTPNIADNDLFEILFRANDDSSGLTNWAEIEAQITDASDETEDSRVLVKTLAAGSSVTSLNLTGNAATFSGTVTTGGNVLSDTDGTDDLGSASVRWNAGYFDELFFQKGANVASATTSFALGADGNYYVVTGTAQIDSITAQSAGKFVYLQTAAACTLQDGGNLKLAGDFNATADDIIKLVTDGTDWYEVSRSVN